MEICKHPDVGRIIFINDEIILNLTPRVLFSYLDEGFVPFRKTSMVEDGISRIAVGTLKAFSYGPANDGSAFVFHMMLPDRALSFYSLDYDSNFKEGDLSEEAPIDTPDPGFDIS